MAVISLDDGKKIKDAPDIAASIPAPPVERKGGIIDLNTGKFVQPVIEPPAQAIEPVAQPDRSLPESIIGGVSGAATLIGDVAGTSAGGLTAFVDLFNPFTDNDPSKTIENIKSKFNIPPTEGGQAAFNKMAAIMEPVKPITDWLTNFRDTAAQQGLDITGSPAVATLIRMLPDIALEVSGAGRIPKDATLQISKAGREAKQAATPVGEFQLEPVTQVQAEMSTARLAEEASGNTGVDLFKAQKTLSPTDLEKQSFVAQLPAGSVRARERLDVQNKQALDAVDTVLNQMAKPEATGAAAGQLRSASQKAVEATKQLRREASSPIYKQAFRRQREGKVGAIDTDSLQTKVDAMAAQFDPEGQIAKNLKSVSRKIKVANGDLQKLHAAKIEIDQTINSFGEGSVGNTTKRFLTDVVSDLTSELTTQSPSYRAAKSEFERMSGPVNKIQDSPIGKIANLDDVQLKSVAQKIFDPSETNPAIMASSKEAIMNVDPSAWAAITRAELERRMGRIKADIASPENVMAVENIPSQLYNSIFGNKKSRDVLFSAVDGEVKSNLKYLETVLKRATKGRPGGSQTGIRSEISRELKGGVFQSLRDFIKSPTGQIASVGEEAAFESRVKALSDIMYDPSWRADMKKLKSLHPSSGQAKKTLDAMLNSALIAYPAITETEEE